MSDRHKIESSTKNPVTVRVMNTTEFPKSVGNWSRTILIIVVLLFGFVEIWDELVTMNKMYAHVHNLKIEDFEK